MTAKRSVAWRMWRGRGTGEGRGEEAACVPLSCVRFQHAHALERLDVAQGVALRDHHPIDRGVVDLFGCSPRDARSWFSGEAASRERERTKSTRLGNAGCASVITDQGVVNAIEAQENGTGWKPVPRGCDAACCSISPSRFQPFVAAFVVAFFDADALLSASSTSTAISTSSPVVRASASAKRSLNIVPA